MKVALLTDGIHPHVIGGMQKHSFYLAKYFAQNKIEIDLYHPKGVLNKQEFLSCFTSEEAIYIQPVFINFPKSTYFPGHYIYESFNYSSAIFQKYIQSKPADFIYAQGFSGWELIKQKKNTNLSIAPIGVNFHGLNMFQPAFGWKNRLNNIFFKPVVKYNIQNADCIFSLGGKLSEIIHRNTQQKNIIEIPIGIDKSWLINNYEIKTNAILKFVFVGRYDKVKGFDLLNKAIRKIIKKNNSCIFEFIGPIPHAIQVKHKNIIYYGEIRKDIEVKNILKQCDVIINSSYSEGMPTAIIEAMACGLAVIATDVGAVSELVNEYNGIIIPSGNSTAIETAISAFINIEPEVLLKMKTHSLLKVKEHFLWNKIIIQTITEIKKIVASAR